MAGEQKSLVEALVSPKIGRNRRLEEIAALIEWRAIEPLVQALRPGETGRPPYDPLAMLKALYLQTLYDLSDEGLEEALGDRVSFRRFCGFALDVDTPDATTLCRFRQAAAAAGVMDRCFAALTGQLEARGLAARKGTLMDATVIAAKHNKPPIEAGRGAKHPKEPDADWTYKAGKPLFGYKLHIGMDEGGLVRRAVFTSAKVYESEAADRLIVGDERAVYGDRAYPSKARSERLRQAGIKDRIMRRADRWHPVLSPRLQRRNALIARRRAPVEAVFSALKRWYGLARARYATLERNAARAIMAITLLNLCRARRRLA
jgi:IS5 family transposase